MRHGLGPRLRQRSRLTTSSHIPRRTLYGDASGRPRQQQNGDITPPGEVRRNEGEGVRVETRFSADADRVIDELESDPEREDLLEVVWDTIEFISENPDSAEARRRGFRTPEG